MSRGLASRRAHAGTERVQHRVRNWYTEQYRSGTGTDAGTEQFRSGTGTDAGTRANTGTAQGPELVHRAVQVRHWCRCRYQSKYRYGTGSGTGTQSSSGPALV